MRPWLPFSGPNRGAASRLTVFRANPRTVPPIHPEFFPNCVTFTSRASEAQEPSDPDRACLGQWRKNRRHAAGEYPCLHASTGLGLEPDRVRHGDPARRLSRRTAAFHPLGSKGVGCKTPLGRGLAIKALFRNHGVASPAKLGRLPSFPPGVHGGNLDNKELVEETTLFLPVWNEGALFSVGDGHAVQGEVCLTAIETALSGTFELVVRKDLSLGFSRA
jgi:hypothetical protein